MNRFEIYVVDFNWKNCHDKRPVVVVSPQWYLDDRPKEDILVAPLSAAMDLQESRCHLLIDSSHPEFGGTGLKKTCYAAIDYITHVERSELQKRVGVLSSELGESLKSFILRFFD